MDFREASRISAILARDYAEDFFKLLVIYKDISASEAASRLELHIKTAQDFLEELNALGVVDKKEVYEKKRPYFRYTLRKRELAIEIDLAKLYNSSSEDSRLKQRIREKANSGVVFNTSGNSDFISSVAVFTGSGRRRKERRINLTGAQGKFLYHLPFPTADHMSIDEIMKKAGVDRTYLPELLDIIDVLETYGVIERLS
jgi:predicted transcriptional regulator